MSQEGGNDRCSCASLRVNGPQPEPGPRALDLRALGARGLQFVQLGRPRDRVPARRWALTGQLDGGGCHGRSLDHERVLVLHRYSGIAKASGLEIGQMAAKGADLFHLSAGKVTRLILYWELDRALTDLGLSA